MNLAVTKPAIQGLYPDSFDDFVGQKVAKAQLLTAARSAKMRGVPMDHVLIADGRPGVGKTSLALLCAKELEANVRFVSGKVKLTEARLLLSSMLDGDVLIIDEVHRMVDGGKKDAEWLLHYLQDGVIVGPRGPEELPRVTVIAATTDAGRLPDTVLGRFPLKPTLVDYTDEEAALIAQRLSRKIMIDPLPKPRPHDCARIARAAANTPRMMTSILVTLRDLTLTTYGETWDEKTETYDLSTSLEWLGLTEDGLTRTAQRYLLALLNDFAGEPVGQTSVQDRLQEPGGLLATERLLMSAGLIEKTRCGRILTAAGIRRARELAADGHAELA